MKKMNKASIVYALICNIPVSFFLCLGSNIKTYGLNIDWLNLLTNYCISLPIAICVSLFVPLVWLGRIVTHLLGVKNDTFTHNMMYRCIATFFYSIIYFLALNPLLTIINGLYFGTLSLDNSFFFNWLRDIPLMIYIGFTASIICDIPAYRLAHKIDSNF